MIETVKTLLFRTGGAGVVHECRRCGTSVDTADIECPECESTDIVTYTTG